MNKLDSAFWEQLALQWSGAKTLTKKQRECIDFQEESQFVSCLPRSDEQNPMCVCTERVGFSAPQKIGMSQKRMKQLSVQFLLLDGTATGPIRIQLAGYWSGLAYRIPKKMLADCKQRKELSFCGIYFLFGNYDKTGEKQVYIGQVSERKNGESLFDRLAEFDRRGSKDCCSEIVFFTTQKNEFGPKA